MHLELSGFVAVSDYVDSFDAWIEAVGTDRTGWRFIGDLRATRGTDPRLDTAVLQAVAARNVELMAESEDFLAAWIATHPLTYALVRQHNSFGRHDDERVAIVHAMPEALAHLGRSPEVLPDWAERA